MSSIPPGGGGSPYFGFSNEELKKYQEDKNARLSYHDNKPYYIPNEKGDLAYRYKSRIFMERLRKKCYRPTTSLW